MGRGPQYCTGVSDQNHPKEKDARRQCLSEEALQIAEERRELKGKGERERYTQWNTQFQRTARRDKKAFFNEQREEIEGNTRTAKRRDLFRKTGDIK